MTHLLLTTADRNKIRKNKLDNKTKQPKMGPKRKTPKKKKGKKNKEKRPRTPKNEYETKIAEKNAVLAAARRKVQEAENAFFETEKNYEQTQEDLTDIIKYLQHEIEENNLEIAMFDEKIAKSREEMSNSDKHYQAILSKLKALYTEKEKVLNYKIRQHLPKLSAFEEVRQQREEFLKKKEQLWNKMKELKARHEKEIYEAEKQVIIKQDTMQKEMEWKLINLASDFNQATDIAIGETTNKLIKENILLGNMLTCTQEIFEKARASYLKVHNMEKRMRCNSELLDEEYHTILQTYSTQVNNIESLVKTQEELRERISLTGKLIKENRRLQREIAEKECILEEKEDEYNALLKKLNESEDKFSSLKASITVLRKNLASIDYALFEASRKARQGIEVENLTEIPEEPGETAPVESEFEDLEEALSEYKYKVRQNILEDMTLILSSVLPSELEQQPDQVSEYGLTPKSTASTIGPVKSRTSNKKV